MVKVQVRKYPGWVVVCGIILSLVFVGGIAGGARAGESVTITHHDQINAENWDRAVYRGIKVADMVAAFDQGGRWGLLRFAKKHGMKYTDIDFYQMAGDVARTTQSADRHAANADRLAMEADAHKARSDLLQQKAQRIKERTDRKFQQGLEMLRE